jgi:hypothetical protein
LLESVGRLVLGLAHGVLWIPCDTSVNKTITGWPKNELTVFKKAIRIFV